MKNIFSTYWFLNMCKQVFLTLPLWSTLLEGLASDLIKAFSDKFNFEVVDGWYNLKIESLTEWMDNFTGKLIFELIGIYNGLTEIKLGSKRVLFYHVQNNFF